MGGLVNAVGNLFGGAPNNSGFVAQSANLIQPVQQGQINSAINNATNTGYVAGQNLQNATAAGQQAGNVLQGQQALAGTLAGQAGQGVGTQNALTQALMAQAQGQGPNPAQAQLAQNTGQNISSTAALMAGSQGASSNPGLIARQIGQQGAATQQGAVGQAATLGAQQQLAAQQQLQQLAASQVGQGQAGVNAAATGALGQEQAQTGIANAATGQEQAATAQQNALLQAMQGYNTQNVQNVASQNAANAAMAQTNANNTSSALGGLTSGLSSGLGSIFGGGGLSGGLTAAGGGARGGVVTKGGKVKLPDHLMHVEKVYHGMSEGGKVLDANARKHIAAKNFAGPDRSYPIEDAAHARNALARVAQHGSAELQAKVRAAVHKKYPSIGKYDDGGVISPSADAPISDVAEQKSEAEEDKPQSGGPLGSIMSMLPMLAAAAKTGGVIPGEPKTPGKNVSSNDTVPILATPKEIVLPLTVTQHEDPGEAAKMFVNALLKKDGDGEKSKEHTEFHAALKKAISTRKGKGK